MPGGIPDPSSVEKQKHQYQSLLESQLQQGEKQKQQ
jgi:hypothetical protein